MKIFCDRFADLPVRVELLSRFRTKKESDAVIEGMSKKGFGRR